jgi:DNA-binding protein HU-beta
MSIVKNSAKAAPAKTPEAKAAPAKSAAKEELKKVKIEKPEVEEAAAEEEQQAVTLGKAEIIESMRAKVKEAGGAIPPTIAAMALAAIEDTISEALAAGNEVRLGIGKFSLTYREEREGRNPKTGEAVQIAASWAPKFKAAPSLKKFINQTEEGEGEEAEGEEAEEAEDE